MKTNLFARTLCAALAFSIATPPAWAVVDISQVPIDGMSNVKPNVVIGMDDSGSMDTELLHPTNDGALWWDTTSGKAWDASGTPYFNTAGVTGSTSGYNFFKYGHLFPNGCSTSTKTYCESSGIDAIPPTAQFATTRSPTYNSLYYNTLVSYSAWVPGYYSSATHTYANATATAAQSHPAVSGSSTMDLTANNISVGSDMLFQGLKGMVIRGDLISGVKQCSGSTGACSTSVTTNVTVASTTGVYYQIPYYPATFWNVESCTVNNLDCALHPNGTTTLKRYEIKSGNTFPSGRTYANEIQNFANWWQYYRKRKLMLAGAMGTVLSNVANIRGGLTQFNSHTGNVTMYDFGSLSDATNYRQIIGKFQTNPASGGTPGRETLKYVGDQFMANKTIIQYACQRNAAFIVTDGFADANPTTPPAYSTATWGTPTPLGVPYTKTYADIALSYFTVNLRPDLATGKVPYDALDSYPGADKNPNLHMNTYGITIGSKGTVFPQVADPFASPPTWPNPSVDKSPTAVDDLWLATLNGRGQLLLATDASILTQNVTDIINDIVFKAGSQSAVGLANPNLSIGTNKAIWSSYNGRGWTGDINASTINLTTGAVSTTALWSTYDQLNTTTWSTRKIGSFNGSSGVAFTDAAIGSRLTYIPAGTSAQLVNWLRGDKSQDGLLYRKRVGILGDIVNAEPVEAPDGSVIFQGANDGMLHVINASTGAELWAYVPGGVHANLGALALKTYSHRFYVDATPTIAKLDTGTTMLVGGLRAGGQGFYALNVTSSTAATDADVAAKVMWEFPNNATSATTRSNLGLSYSRPAIVKTAANGWVVLMASGYNPSGDGKGRVFMLDAATGTVLREFVTTAVSDIGQVSAFLTKVGSEFIASAAYAGDLAGNLWKFDIVTGTTSRVATLTDASGSPQPITAAPELTTVKSVPVILIGTGRLLGESDYTQSQTQTFYAISDTGTTVSNVRTALDARTLVVSGSTRTLAATTPDWTTRRGWYFDLPSGEIANTDPQVAQGAVFFTTNKPTSVACASESFLYMVDITSGSQRQPEQFTGSAWTGTKVGDVLASRPVLARLPSLSLIALTHESNNSILTTYIKPPKINAPRRAAWKEVQR